MTAEHLHVERLGEIGPSVVLVHGCVTNGRMTWREQRALADRWRLSIVDRRGYHPNPPTDVEDYEADAEDIAGLLGAGAHLVGHSYGGVIALVTAARHPGLVRSLTVIEPPAYGPFLDRPDISSYVRATDRYFATSPSDPREFLQGFLDLVGADVRLPACLPDPLLQSARLLMSTRSPAEADIPLDALHDSNFPKLVVSGQHHAVFDHVCDLLQRGLGAQRAVIPGAGHNVQRTGAPFNERLEAFMSAAEYSD